MNYFEEQRRDCTLPPHPRGLSVFNSVLYVPLEKKSVRAWELDKHCNVPDRKRKFITCIYYSRQELDNTKELDTR
jgi:hypothetical protein